MNIQNHDILMIYVYNHIFLYVYLL